MRVLFKWPTLSAISFILLTIFLMSGCGGERTTNKPAGTISGKVLFNGKPLPAGILVVHAKGSAAEVSAQISDDGSYAVDVPFSGEATVTVATAHLNPDKSQIAMEKRERMDPKAVDPDNQMQQGINAADQEKMKKEKEKWSKMYSKAKSPNMPDPSRYRAIPKKYADPKESPLRVVIKGGPQVEDFQLTGS